MVSKPGEHSFTSKKGNIDVTIFVSFLLDNIKQKVNNPRNLRANLKFILTHTSDILKMLTDSQSN